VGVLFVLVKLCAYETVHVANINKINNGLSVQAKKALETSQLLVPETGIEPVRPL
jgi:hypothetical protein